MDLKVNVLPVYLVPEVLAATDPTSAVIFGRLLNFGAAPGKDVYYSIRRAANELHVSVNTVRRAFEVLKKNGFLTITKVKTVKDTGNPTIENRYLVNFSAISHVSETDISGSDTPVYQFLIHQKVIRKEKRSSKKGGHKEGTPARSNTRLSSEEFDAKNKSLAERMRAKRQAEAAAKAKPIDCEEVKDDDDDDKTPPTSGDKK